MEVIILDNADAVAQLGAQRICELINKKPGVVLGLATGSTPIAMYRQLIDLYRQRKVSFNQATTFNLDEYIGIAPDDPQSYRTFMNRELFDEIDIDQASTYLPACSHEDNPRDVGINYEQAITEAGGVDLQILGIGSNGHIGFNEPTSSLASRTRVKTLTQKTLDDNSRLFGEGEWQPRLAMTMGIATILEARHIIVLATGEYKAQAVSDAVEGPVTAICPASALQMHERVSFILDQAAASKLKHLDYYYRVHKVNEPLVQQYGHFYEIE